MLLSRADVRKRMPPGVVWYSSGADREQELRGLQLIGIPAGVSVDHLSEAAINFLIRNNQPVFVDSGAFSEVKLSGQEWEIVREISHPEWKRRLTIYKRLARELRSKLTCVAPDRIGSQEVTLTLLERYREELTEIAKEGAELLLPMQIGDLPHEAFYRLASKVCGLELTPAMPMRKAATRLDEVAEFVIQLNPKRIHFLGVGPEARKAWDIIRVVRFYGPETKITMDSNGLRAKLGANRPLTLTETRLRTAEIRGVYGVVESEVFDLLKRGLDYTDAIAFPSAWISATQLTDLGHALRISEGEMQVLLTTPDVFLHSTMPCSDSTWIEHPVVSLALDLAWEQYLDQEVKADVRAAAIVATLADSMSQPTF